MDALQLDLLGGFRARTATGAVLALPTRKTQALLAFLAVQPGQTHARNKLAALLWGDMRQKQSRGNLRQALVRLRRSLGDALRLDGEEVGLDPARVLSDVQRFEECAAEGTPEALTEASRLYQGDFLAGLSLQEPSFEEWLLAQRERLRERALEVVARLLAHHRQAGQLEAALQSALQLLTLDPLQEPVHRTLMRLYVQLGRRGAALRQYQVCTTLLERELRAQPEPETKTLYQRILTERPGVSPLVEEGFAASAAETAPASPSPPAAAAAAPPSSKSLDALATDAPLVGREAELARFTELLDGAWSGRGTIAALLGDPGVGKSRLAAEVAIQAAGRGACVLVGRCFEVEQRLPFAAWVDALRDGGILADGTLIDSLAPVWRRELARLLPELGEPAPPAPEGGSSDPQHLFEALARLLEALTRRAPLVILVEDGHWMDEMSLRLLPFLARRIRKWPLIWLGTFREEELAGDPRFRLIGDDLAREGLAVQLRLAPLSRAETVALVRQLVPPGTPERVGEQVWRTSEGNAFMAVETARTLADPDGGASSDPALIPRRVRDLVAGRLERLSPGARRVVALAATIGRRFEFPLVREASEVAEGEVAEALEELVRRRIFQPSGEGFEFTHDRIREVAYASLLLPRRSLLHRHVAEALERLRGAEAPDVADGLAFHYRRAGAWAKAVQHLSRFAEQAARGYAHGDAAEALQQALDALGRTPASRERDRVHLELSLRRAQSLYFVGAAGESLATLQAGTALLASVDDPALSGPWYFWLGRMHGLLGNSQDARANACHALEEAGRARDDATSGKAYGVLSLASFWSGRPREGVQHGERAAALLATTSEHWWEGVAHFYTAFNEVQLGRLGLAQETLARMHAIGERLADNRLCAFAALMTGWAQALEGRAAAGIASCRRGLELAPDPVSAARAVALLGEVYLEAGEADDAVPRLIQAIESHRHFGYRAAEAQLMAVLADARRLQGHDDVVDLAARAWEFAREVGVPFPAGLARRAMGRIALARGALDDAEQLLGEALQIFSEIEAEFEAGRTRLDLAAIASQRGDVDRARAHLDAARAAFERLDVGFYVARATELARCL